MAVGGAGHNGGCIRFGPDGDLYLSTGDGSGIADEFATGQDLGDLLGAILRIDVDRPQGDCPYTLP
jgi:glucose/arabinose dehydrogenase